MTPETSAPPLYWDWIRSEAALIRSDGCTGVSGLFRECCWEHDLAFYYARSAQDAYQRFCLNFDRVGAWQEAPAITFEQANSDFRRCHIQRTKLGSFWWLNPMVWWRWRGVVRLSRSRWDAHRARPERAWAHG
jgi:hypothetical protein